MKIRTLTLACFVALGLVAQASYGFSMYNYKFTVALDGTQEVGGGDPDGSGTAEILIDALNGIVWWDIVADNIAPIFADHIHKAPVGTNGPAVVNFSGTLSGMAAIDTTLAQDIVTNFDQYYVNLHNNDYRGGAIRGQLSAPVEVAKPVPDTTSTSLLILTLGTLFGAHHLRKVRRS